MKSPVIKDIVENNLCIGCGLCSAICPQHTLEMKWNQYGEYNPIEVKSCDTECGLCLKVCPFEEGNDNEDTIGKAYYGNIPGVCHRPETGYFLESFVGYAPNNRELGSSGGMATWLLSTLLKKGIVDYVIAVVPNDDPDQLFKFAVLNNPESILKSSGSAYYPVELSGVLREIQNKPGKCAIIGLPCFIKAIRLATQKNKKLNEKIHTIVGIVCGQLKSKYYTEYISALSGVNTPLQKVNFRGKSPEKPASNFYFSCTSKKGAVGKIFWDEGVAEAWLNRWFTPNACNYCDDVFAECADVTFMDAWLPEYFEDHKGNNLILVRSVNAQKIIHDGIAYEEINLKMIPIQKVIESQPAGISEKRINLAYRLYLSVHKGYFAPQKRIKPMKITNPFQKKRIIITNRMCIASRNIWTEQYRKGTINLENYRDQMNTYLVQVSRWNRISKTVKIPLRLIHYIRRKIRINIHG
jgi:coenzyme F420-reducing hydrogenase beta subunit